MRAQLSMGLHMSTLQVRSAHGASGNTTWIPLRAASGGRRFCALGILYRPCVPCCVHLWVASIQWKTCAIVRDVRYPEHRRGGNLYVSKVLVAHPKPSLTVMCVIAVPLSRGEDRTDARGAFLQLGMIDDGSQYAGGTGATGRRGRCRWG
jgi:hypothetical protein